MTSLIVLLGLLTSGAYLLSRKKKPQPVRVRARKIVAPLLAVAAACAVVGCSSGGSGSSLAEITSAEQFDFSVLKADDVVLVDFSAPWCGACKVMNPKLEAINEKGLDGVRIVKVNTDNFSDLAKKYEVEYLPTLLVFKKGEVAKKWVGVQDQGDVEAKLTALARG